MEIRTDRTTITTKSMVKLIKLPDLLSILNALFGFAAILLVLGGTSVSGTALKNALILILLAAVVDGLDGIVARSVECSLIGEYLDSLADLLSFGMAPAIVAYVFIQTDVAVSSLFIDVGLAFCGAYVVSGMLRLARFNALLSVRRSASPGGEKIAPSEVPMAEPASSPERRPATNDFVGFPITGAATFLAAFMLLIIELQVPSPFSATLLIAVIGMLCFLMASRIRYRVLRDKRIVIPVGILLFALFLFYIASLGVIYLALAIVTLTAVYICSPLLLKKREKFM